MKNLNRRGFIKRGITGAAAVAISPAAIYAGTQV